MWRKKLNDTLARIVGKGNRSIEQNQHPNLNDQEIIKKRKGHEVEPQANQSNISLANQAVSLEEKLERFTKLEPIPEKNRGEVNVDDTDKHPIAARDKEKIEFKLRRRRNKQLNKIIEREKQECDFEDGAHEDLPPLKKRMPKLDQIMNKTKKSEKTQLQKQIEQKINQLSSLPLPPQAKQQIQYENTVQIVYQEPEQKQQTIQQEQKGEEQKGEEQKGEEQLNYIYEMPIEQNQNDQSEINEDNCELPMEGSRSKSQPIQKQQQKPQYIYQLPLSAHSQSSQSSYNQKSQQQSVINRSPEIKNHESLENSQAILLESSLVKLQSVSQLKQKDEKAQKLIDQYVKVDTSSNNLWFAIKIIIILAILGVVSMVLFMNSCAIFNLQSCQPQQDSTSFPPLIVSRNFKPNQCFVVNYSKNTSTIVGNTSSLVRTNESFYYCIRGIAANGDINLIGYYKHISEQDLTTNPPTVNYFDTSIMLESPLLNSPASNFSIANGSGFTSSNASINASMMNKIINNFVMFQFSISRNGTLLNLIINSQNNNATIAQLPKLIKLFFPKIDLSLYLPPSRRLQTEGEYEDRLLQANSTNGTDNSTTNNESFGYVDNNGGAQLSNNINTAPSPNDTVYASHAVATQSNFDGSGQLNEGSLQGSSAISAPQLPSSSDHQVINMPTQISLSQNVSMSLAATMNNLTNETITQFYAFFYVFVVQTNQTLSFTEAELSAYLINQQNNSVSNRLLSSNSATLFLKRHEFMLLQTNALGMSLIIKGLVYMEIDMNYLSLFEYQPQFKSGTELAFKLGPFSLTFTIFQYRHQFDPLSLGITLNKINSLIHLFTDDFLTLVHPIADLSSFFTFYGSFADQLAPMLNQIKNTINLINQQQQKLIPGNFLQKVLDNLAYISSNIESEGSSFINAHLATIKNLQNQLYQFSNITYNESLLVFRGVQQQFKDNSLNSSFFLQDLRQKSIPTIDQYSNYIQSVINGQLSQLYQAELQKAMPFFNLYAYIKNITNDINANFSLAIQNYQTNYQTTLLTFLDSFYIQNLNNFQQIVSFSQQKQTILNNSFNSVSSILQSSKSTVQGYLNSIILDFYKQNTLTQNNINSVLNSYTSMLTVLDNIAGDLQNNFPSGCGSWGSWFWQNPMSCFSGTFRDAANSVSTMASMIGMFKSNTSMLSYQMSQLSTFISNVDKNLKSNDTIQQKYMNVINEINGIVSFYSQVSMIQNSFYVLQNTVTSYRNTIINSQCCFDCCQVNNVNLAINYLGNMLTTITNFNQQWQNFISLPSFKNYTDTISLFSNSNYDMASSYFTVSKDTNDFFLQETGIISQFSSILKTIKQTKDAIKPNYLKGKRIYLLIQSSFTSMSDYTSNYCESNSTKNDQILALRSQYNTSINVIQSFLTNSLLQNSFTSLIDAYKSLSANAFIAYTPLDLCNPTIVDLINITLNSTEDAVNFMYIQKIANNILPLLAQASNFITSNDKRLTLFDKKIYKIYNYAMFNTFIDNETILIYDIKNFTQQFGLNMSSIKDSMTNIYKFATVDVNNTWEIIQIFNGTNLNINYITIYSSSDDLLKQALDALFTLNYEVFFTYITILSEIENLSFDKDTIQVQTERINSLTVNLTNLFIGLGGGVTQQFLKDIENKYLGLKQLMPRDVYDEILGRILDFDTYFQNIFETFQQYSIDFSQDSRIRLMKLHNMTNSKLFNLIMSSLSYYKQVNSDKFELINSTILNFDEIIDVNADLIASLKIGYLNTIAEIGGYIQNQYLQYKSYFEDEVSQVIARSAQIQESYFFIIGTSSLITEINTQLGQTLEDTLTNITSQVNEYISLIANDPQIYSAFAKTAQFANLKHLDTLLTIDFNQIWSSFQSYADQIYQIESKVSPSTLSVLETFIHLKQNLTSVASKIQGKVESMNLAFSSANDFLDQLKSLLFTILQKELNSQVKDKLLFAKELLLKLTRQDLPIINVICTTSLPQDQLSVLTSLKLINTYKQQIYQGSAPTFLKNIEDDIIGVISFLGNSLVVKFGRLREGQYILQAITRSQDPTGNIVLFQYELYSKEIPIVDLEFNIPTPVGVFIFSFLVDFTFGCDIVITLIDLRSVDIGINLHTELSLQARFGYGIPRIVEVGMYIKGTVMKIQVQPGFELQHLIPVQLIPVISQIAQFKDGNAFALNFYMDMKINTCIFEIGGFISHIGIDIFWIHISFCINIDIWFIHIHFCIDFQLPIIILIWQTDHYGKQLSNIGLLNKRLFSLTIFTLQF